MITNPLKNRPGGLWKKMSYGFLFMIITVSCALGVYYLWSFKLGLNENTGLLLSALTAVLVSCLFYRLKKN
jgi:hypothetical protein